MGARSVSASANKSRRYQPSDMDHLSDILALYWEQLRTHHRNAIHAGGLAGAPTSASTQLTGAAGVTEWRIDIATLIATVGGVAIELAVAADHVVHDTTVLVTAAGQTCWCALVLKNVSGTITMVSVKGTPAATAAAVPPTDAEIQTAVAAGNEWVKLAECEITRTADTTVTQTQDNTKRPILGVTVDLNVGDF